jgi:hypothetical protein
VSDPGLLEFRAEGDEAMSLIERQYLSLRIDHDAIVTEFSGKREHAIEQRVADSASSPRSRDCNPPDMAIREQPGAANGMASFILGDGVATVSVDAVPFELFWNLLLDDEHNPAYVPERRPVLRPVGEADPEPSAHAAGP